jgi:hypothetical protein
MISWPTRWASVIRFSACCAAVTVAAMVADPPLDGAVPEVDGAGLVGGVVRDVDEPVPTLAWLALAAGRVVAAGAPVGGGVDLPEVHAQIPRTPAAVAASATIRITPS